MKINDEVFWLIKSMSRNEKGYFKKFSERHKANSKFVLLFDAIEKQAQKSEAEYDEEKIKEKLSKERFVKNMRMAKSYLHQLILQSLALYHRDLESEMDNLLQHIRILYDKQLYLQCEKHINKGIEIAKGRESFLHELQFLMWKERMMRAHNFILSDENEIESLFGEMKRVMSKQKNYTDYLSSSSAIAFSANKKGFARNMNRKTNISGFDKKLYDSEESALSHKALFHYYNYHYSNFISEFNYKKAGEIAKKMVELIENTSSIIARSPVVYINTLERFINTQMRLKKYDVAEQCIRKLKEVKAVRPREKAELFFKSTIHESVLYLKKANVPAGLTLISQIEKQLPDLANDYSAQSYRNVSIMNYHVALLYFMAEKYAQANKCLNKIINVSTKLSTSMRDDYFSYARILNLIINYEMGKEDLIEYSVKSVYRDLLKRNNLHKMEEAFLKFIKKDLQKISTQEQQVKAFTKLKHQLEEIAKDPFEEYSLNYFDTIAWLESKISNKSFAQIIKNKASH